MYVVLVYCEYRSAYSYVLKDGAGNTCICPYCQKPIEEGTYVTGIYIHVTIHITALGERWHDDHFLCSTKGCNKKLGASSFFTIDGKAYWYVDNIVAS